MSDSAPEEQESVSSVELEQSHRMEILTICLIVAGGGFIASATLLEIANSEPVVKPVRLVLATTGGGMAGISFALRKILKV